MVYHLAVVQGSTTVTMAEALKRDSPHHWAIGNGSGTCHIDLRPDPMGSD